MMLMYALEKRGPAFIAAFALGCALSSTYGFLSGAWPFGVVEGIWTFVALRRYLAVRAGRPDAAPRGPARVEPAHRAPPAAGREPRHGSSCDQRAFSHFCR